MNKSTKRLNHPAYGYSMHPMKGWMNSRGESYVGGWWYEEGFGFLYANVPLRECKIVTLD